LVGHGPLPGDVRPPAGLGQAPADRLDVLDESWLAHEAHGLLDLLGLLAAELLLFLRRDREAAASREPAEQGGEAGAARAPGERTRHVRGHRASHVRRRAAAARTRRRRRWAWRAARRSGRPAPRATAGR